MPKRIHRLLLLSVVLLISSVQCVTAATTIDFMAWSGGADDSIRKVASMFEEENPDIKVNVRLVPYPELADKVITQTIAGDPPDVVCMMRFHFPDFVSQELATDLTDFVRRDADEIKLEDYHPMARSAIQFAGRYWALPWEMGVQTMFFNRDLFNARGLPSPHQYYVNDDWDWNQLRVLARKLTERDLEGNVKSIGLFMQFEEWYQQPWVYAAGGEWFTPDLAKSLATSNEVRQAVEFTYELLHEDKTMLRPGEPPGWDTVANGQWGLWPQWQMTINVLDSWDISYDFDVVLHPKGPGGDINSGHVHSLFIPVGVKQKDAAWRFLKYLALTGYNLMVRDENFPSLRRSTDTVYIENTMARGYEGVRFWLDDVERTRLYEVTPRFKEVHDEIIVPHLFRVWRNEVSPIQALENISKELDALLAEM